MYCTQTSPLLRSIFTGLLFCFLSVVFTSCDNTQVIVNGLEEKEANEILVFLAGKGIQAKKIKGAEGGPGGGAILYDIGVDGDNAVEAMAILNMNGLPRRRGQNLLGLFQKAGLVPSEMEERVRYQAGLAEQIASIIRKIDGVLDADIQLSFPEEDPLNPGKKIGNVTASAYVKHQGVLDDPNTHLITKIKRLVASSIQGLEYDGVTVISDRARFSDVQLQQAGGIGGEKEFVKVWSVVIAKESLSFFRFLFFAMILLLILFIMATLFLLWKSFPTIRKVGLRKSLSPSPFPLAEQEDEEKEEGEEKPEEKSEDKEEEEGEEEEEQEDKGVT